MTYNFLDSCGNHSISAKYVVDNLLMCGIRVNTHTHTFSSRVFYRKYLKYQRAGKVVFSGFADIFFRLFSTQWCSAPPCGGCQSIVSSYYGVIGRHLSCLIRNAVFSYELSTSKTDMNVKRKRCYVHPIMNVVEMSLTQIIATSSNVTVCGWGDGGSLGGGEAEESASRRGEWGNLWYNN